MMETQNRGRWLGEGASSAWALLQSRVLVIVLNRDATGRWHARVAGDYSIDPATDRIS